MKSLSDLPLCASPCSAKWAHLSGKLVLSLEILIARQSFFACRWKLNLQSPGAVLLPQARIVKSDLFSALHTINTVQVCKGMRLGKSMMKILIVPGLLFSKTTRCCCSNQSYSLFLEIFLKWDGSNFCDYLCGLLWPTLVCQHFS